jgi:PTH1 family peptidyl-tRNA hydrolase
MQAASQPIPRLVVGLGNPGPDYAETRHNAGFWFCERLAMELGAAFSNESRFHGRVAHVRQAGVWLLLPQTFMNRSGQSVVTMARFHRITPAEILVVHDELDIPPGQLRLKFGGGLGGHNGLKDITAHLGTQDYWRLRIGIGHPGDRNEVVNYVLKPPRREERPEIDASLERALTLWPFIQKGEWNVAVQRANARLPPKSQATPTNTAPSGA